MRLESEAGMLSSGNESTVSCTVRIVVIKLVDFFGANLLSGRVFDAGITPFTDPVEIRRVGNVKVLIISQKEKSSSISIALILSIT